MRIGDVGLAWVRESLGAPGTPLAELALEDLPLTGGVVLALGLEGIRSIQDARQLQRSAASSGGSIDSLSGGACLFELLSNLRTRLGGPHILVIESDVRKPYDHAAENRPSGTALLLSDRSVCYAKDIDSVQDSSELLIFLNSAPGYFLNCFLVQGLSIEALSAVFQEGGLSKVTDGSIGVINRIFDGEGYSVWLSAGLVSEIGEDLA